MINPDLHLPPALNLSKATSHREERLLFQQIGLYLWEWSRRQPRASGIRREEYPLLPDVFQRRLEPRDRQFAVSTAPRFGSNRGYRTLIPSECRGDSQRQRREGPGPSVNPEVCRSTVRRDRPDRIRSRRRRPDQRRYRDPLASPPNPQAYPDHFRRRTDIGIGMGVSDAALSLCISSSTVRISSPEAQSRRSGRSLRSESVGKPFHPSGRFCGIEHGHAVCAFPQLPIAIGFRKISAIKRAARNGS